ncbi:MAG: Ig-like domain-containing protein, partial [Nitrososphaerales archaeon]
THLTASGSGQSVLTASSQGLSSSQVDLQLTRSPLVDQLTASIPEETLYGADTMYTNGTATMTLSVSFLGQPVQNLNVSWTVTGGSVSPNPTKTGSSGATSTTFKPNKVGTANITASASSPLTGPIILTHFIAVFQAQTTTTTGGTTTATATTKTVTKSTTATTTVVSTETSYSTVTSSTTFTATVTSSTTIATTATSPTTTTVTTTTTSLSTSAASTFAYATLGATTIVILTVAALAAWVLRGRRP